MTIHVDKPAGAPAKVTTGEIKGSRRIFSSPKARPDVSVPFREVGLSAPAEAPIRLYDTSGPYTDATASIALAKGAPRIREPWIAKRGYAAIEGRAVKPEDN